MKQSVPSEPHYQLMSKFATEQLKGIAIILVIVGHLSRTTLLPFPIKDILKFAGAWGVAIFLILSGYGLAQSYLKNGTHNFFTKRLSTVIIPYSIVTIVWLAVDSAFLQKAYGLKTIILSLIGLDFQSTVDNTMWYISFLLVWYLAFFLVFRFLIRSQIKVFMLFIFAIFLYNFGRFAPGSGAELYVWEFPIGVALGLLFSSLRSNKINLLFLLSAATLNSLLFVFVIGKSGQSYMYYALSNLSFALGSVSIVSLISSRRINLHILNYIGSISYPLYLVEGVFLWKYPIFSLPSNMWLNLAIYTITIFCLSNLLKIVSQKAQNLILNT